MTIAGQYQDESGKPQDDLVAYFNKSVSAVQLYADHFEHDVVRPAFASSHVFFKERPITATFVAVFSLLSFVPVLSFIGAFVFASVGVVLIALLATVLACGMALITLLSLLFFALFINFFTALSLTGLITFAYVLLRLAVLVREGGPAGVSHWVAEIQGFLLHASPIKSAALQRESPALWPDNDDTVVAQATPVSQSSHIKEEKPPL